MEQDDRESIEQMIKEVGKIKCIKHAIKRGFFDYKGLIKMFDNSDGD